ncbi:hypothetical protein PUN28_013594 [Cardiocondyla obscurior]|uniref:Uncharacterized protein n=1 Tax=Cardiocondyla obscurior TaxID=286306 RepID=A0AAW2F234_9HYME
MLSANGKISTENLAARIVFASVEKRVAITNYEEVTAARLIGPIGSGAENFKSRCPRNSRDNGHYRVSRGPTACIARERCRELHPSTSLMSKRNPCLSPFPRVIRSSRNARNDVTRDKIANYRAYSR